MNLVIKVDARELNNAMHKAPEKVLLGLNKWVSRTALRTERAAKLAIPPSVDTGRLLSSVHSMTGMLKAEVKPTAKYAIFVHQGRKPGKMPPSGPGTELNRWATKRGMNPFLVARSIKRKGIKPNPYMNEAFRQVKPIAELDGNNTLNEIVRSI